MYSIEKNETFLLYVLYETSTRTNSLLAISGSLARYSRLVLVWVLEVCTTCVGLETLFR
jgi:hypothetical protein